MIPITIFHNFPRQFSALGLGGINLPTTICGGCCLQTKSCKAKDALELPLGAQSLSYYTPTILVQQGYTWKWVIFLILWDLQKSSRMISDSPICIVGGMSPFPPKKMIDMYDMNVIGGRKFAA